jgi:hypothetical protein
MLDAASAGSLVPDSLLDSVSAANTAAATTASGSWVDSSIFEGYILARQNVGAVTGTGSVAGQIMTSASPTGSNPVAVTGGAFAAVTVSSSEQALAIPKTALTNRYVGYVGTITGLTGALVSASILAAKKYT